MSPPIATSSATLSGATVIIPPPEIRQIAEKTAAFVARNGPLFETRIRENESQNPRFCFLNSNDPYHAYYRQRILDIQSGKVQPSADVPMATVQPMVNKRADAPEQPPPYDFLLNLPPIAAQDFHILQLAALFTAKNGRPFMAALAQREHRNYQFDFLRPTHSLFPLFTRLVEQYTKVMIPPRDITQKLDSLALDKFNTLERVRQRARWVAYQEAERKRKEEKEEKERTEWMQVDWHDFVVVQTVEFTAQETVGTANLPRPVTKPEVESMSMAQRKLAMNEIAMGGIKTPVVAGPQQPIGPTLPSVMPTGSMHMPPPVSTQTAVPVPSLGGKGTIKIRTDYVPKPLAMGTKKTAQPTQLCPRCGQAIPISEMAEHMRIELLDPKWKEQRQTMEQKTKTSNVLTEGTDIAAHLKNLSSYRADIFGEADELDVAKRLEEERKKKLEKEQRAWDGTLGSASLAQQRALRGIAEEVVTTLREEEEKERQAAAIGPRIGGQPPPSIPTIPSTVVKTAGPIPPASLNMPPPPLPLAFQGMAPPPPMGMPPPFAPGMRIAVPPPSIPVTMPAPVRFVPASTESDVKKAKIDDGPFLPEDQWLAQNKDPVMIHIQVANVPDKPELGLLGQRLDLNDIDLKWTVSQLKSKLTELMQGKLPPGRQKLTSPVTSNVPKGMVMKDSLSLAYYNIRPGDIITLALKERGGRR